MEGIQIYELKRMDLRGATVIDGFPSVGLVSSIVANYLINALNLVQIGIMDSVYFPTVALVRDGQPMNPVRIYAGPKMDERDQIVVFISEFQPPPNLIKAIASTVLDWAQDARCNLLVCPEGLIVDAQEDEGGDRQVEVYGIGSTDKTMDMIRKSGITVFEEGVITGVAGGPSRLSGCAGRGPGHRGDRQTPAPHGARRATSLRGGGAHRDAVEVDQPPDRGREETEYGAGAAEHVRLGAARHDSNLESEPIADDLEVDRQELRQEPHQAFQMAGDLADPKLRGLIRAGEIDEELIRGMHVKGRAGIDLRHEG